MATFSDIQDRYLILKSDAGGAIDDTGKSHINWAIKDILNAFPFSWNIKKTDLTLSSGTASLPSDYNPTWHIDDARIVNSSTNDDNIFREASLGETDLSTDNYIYWITYDTSSNRYIFNSNQTSGTVQIYYHFVPSELSNDGDTCVVPDGEAVAYLAASKNWIGDERNTGLQAIYAKEAGARIQNLYTNDIKYGDIPEQGSVIDYNSQLRGV